MRRTVSMSIGCVDTGCTTPLTLMLIGAPHEMKRSEACFSAISLNSRSRYMKTPCAATARDRTGGLRRAGRAGRYNALLPARLTECRCFA